MGALVLLGLVASVFLVFSNSLQFVRIGLVAALWAAAVGALAATKFRKEAAIDKAKVRDLQTVYELQLEREVTARREYELGVESRVREEVGADASEMAALRAELAVLRQSLHRLFDGDLLVERPALHADATRIQELESGLADPANDSSANADTPDTHPANGSMTPVLSMTPVFVPDHPEPPQFATPFDEPVTAETSAVPVEPADDEYADDGYDTDDRYEGDERYDGEEDDYEIDGDGFARVRNGLADESDGHDAADDRYDTGSFRRGLRADFDSDDYDTGRFRMVDYQNGGFEAVRAGYPDGEHHADPLRAATGWSGAFTEPDPEPEAEPEAVRAPEPEPEPEPEEPPAVAPRLPDPTPLPRPATAGTPAARPVGTAGSRRRRRDDDDGEPGSGPRRLSVAEIMANLQSENGRG